MTDKNKEGKKMTETPERIKEIRSWINELNRRESLPLRIQKSKKPNDPSEKRFEYKINLTINGLENPEHNASEYTRFSLLMMIVQEYLDVGLIEDGEYLESFDSIEYPDTKEEFFGSFREAKNELYKWYYYVMSMTFGPFLTNKHTQKKIDDHYRTVFNRETKQERKTKRQKTQARKSLSKVKIIRKGK